ncbi:hypothetical protein HY312_03770 [Candidatus Saccharibacteria bacterium]|nr:hypothetical protein [Candidatus Saccharibacteria bacterium]
MYSRIIIYRIYQDFIARNKFANEPRKAGYILPVVIVLSLAIMMIFSVLMQSITSTSSNLNQAYTKQLNSEAAQAGLAYAISCLKTGTTTWTTLTPSSDCDGNPSTGNDYVAQTDNWKSTFVVESPVVTGSMMAIVAKATVTFYGASGSTVQVVSTTAKKSVPLTNTIVPVSSGESVTDLSVDGASCSIANGKLYCWGRNVSGELGIGNTANQTTPQLVAATNPGDAFYNKRVSAVATGSRHTCAIADSTLYCWGRNSDGELGIGNYNATYTTPQVVGGALSGRKVTKVTVAQGSINNHTCAIADGIAYCWGANGVQQLGQANYVTIPFAGIVGINPFTPDKASRNLPVPVYGYHTDTNGYDSGSDLYGKKAVDIGTGVGGSCAIVDGGVYCWGDLTQIILPEYPHQKTGTLSGKIAMAGSLNVSGNTTCSVAGGGVHCSGFIQGRNGVLGFCWGNNTKGQVGTGDTMDRIKPTSPMSTVGIVTTKVAAGDQHTCSIANGQLYCWGDNTYGQIGIGSSGPSPVLTPTLVSYFNGKTVTDVSAGKTTTCAIADGQAYCWGDNTTKQLGDGTFTARSSPVAVSGGSNVLTGKAITSISAGVTHTCAVANASAYCWGSNSSAATGLGTTSGIADPTRVSGGSAAASAGNITAAVTQISAGNGFSCAIINGVVNCWGLSTRGQTGTGTTAVKTVPTLVSGGAGSQLATHISTGDTHACAVMQNDTLCWGDNTNGQIGNGVANATPVLSPVLIGGGDLVGRASVVTSAGGTSSCSLANATIQCWGSNTKGQLGNDSLTNSTLPKITSDYTIVSPLEAGIVF